MAQMIDDSGLGRRRFHVSTLGRDVLGLGRAAARRWQAYRAAQLIQSLPDGVMKDIGYPAPGDRGAR